MTAVRKQDIQSHQKYWKSLSGGAIAEALDAEVHGERTLVLSCIQPLESATPSDLSFAMPGRNQPVEKAIERAMKSNAGALLVPQYVPVLQTTQIVTPNPMAAIIRLTELFHERPKQALGVHPQASVSQTALVGENVSIGAFAVVGDDVELGDRCVIYPHAVIYPGAKIGPDCVIHAGAVIREMAELGTDCLIQPGVVVGGDGFGYIPDSKLGHKRIPHVGRVVLGDRVDLGANATVDRATLGQTTVGEATKIDNLVMVGHNVSIGKRNLFCSQVGISGSTSIGDDVLLAGQVGVADHVSITDKVRAAARCGITGNVVKSGDIAGFPPQDAKTWRQNMVLLRKLSEYFKRIRKLEEKVQALKPSDIENL